MQNYLIPLSGLLICAALFSCGRTTDTSQQAALEHQRRDSLRAVAVRDSIAHDSAAKANSEKAGKHPADVNQALRQDAQLARKMPLKKFSEYMKTRQDYYSRYKEFSYEDEYVKIKKDGDELKIETPNGKAKFEDGETKIKTDTYNRKTETD